jgi:hypothetical protein
MTRSRHQLTLPRIVVLAALLALAAASPGTARAADRIGTVAGSAAGGFGGDGGPATAALLSTPSDVAPLDGGDAYLIADTDNHRIRRVSAAGTITTVAGLGPTTSGGGGYGGDGRLAIGALLNAPRGVSPTSDGGFLIADTGNNRIRAVSPAGVITTVAGTGTAGFTESDLSPTQAQFNAPQGVAALPDGSFVVADTGNNRIRLVLPGPSGRVFTIAGTGTAAFTGDGGPATSAALNAPTRVVPLAGGGFLIADTGNNRIRRIPLDGPIETVAGSSLTPGFGGDGGSARAALLNRPEGVAVRADGSIVIADTGNQRIREVDVTGRIRTIAGTGTAGFSGDGGPPTAAQLAQPRQVAISGQRLRIADAFNHRVRAVTPDTTTRPDPPPPAPPVVTPPRQVPPGVAPPVLGRTTVATPVRGRVLIRRPGAREFAELDVAAGIPLGSEVDATSGTVLLLFTTDRRGRRASALVSEGRFVVRQPGRPGLIDRGQRPGTLVLSGPLAGCRVPRPARGRARARRVRPRAAAAGPRASAAAKRRKQRKGRRLRVEADGAIKTQGRYGAAIVRGTRWTIVDRCPRDPRPGTFVKVSQGRVAVRSFVLRRTVLVRTGRRYLAPASARRR